MHRSINDIVSAQPTILPIVGNNDTEGTGTGVSLVGYASALALVAFGASGDTLSGSVSVLAKLQESDDNVTFTDVAAADLDGAFTIVDDPDEDDTVQAVGYLGTAKWLRIFLDFTGTHTNGIPVAAVIVRGHPTYAPTT